MSDHIELYSEYIMRNAGLDKAQVRIKIAEININNFRYTEELYKKDLHDQDNHNGVITHPEPDALNGKSTGL